MRSPWQVLKSFASRGKPVEAVSDEPATRLATTAESVISPVDETEQPRPASVEPTMPLSKAGVNTSHDEPIGAVVKSLDEPIPSRSAPIKAAGPNASAFAEAARPSQASKKRSKAIKLGIAAVPPEDVEPSALESGIASDIEIQQLRSRLGAKLREQNSQMKTLLDRYESR